MEILILIHVSYLQNVAFSFEITPQQILIIQLKNLPTKISHFPRLGGEFPHLPL